MTKLEAITKYIYKNDLENHVEKLGETNRCIQLVTTKNMAGSNLRMNVGIMLRKYFPSIETISNGNTVFYLW